MATLNAIAQERLREVLEAVQEISLEDMQEERSIIDKIVTDISAILETGGLPAFTALPINNPVDSGVSSEYLDDIQKQMVTNFGLYERFIKDMAARLNILIAKLAERLDEKEQTTAVQAQEIKNLREMAINRLNNISILGEFVVQHETLKSENVATRDCTITPKGTLTLARQTNLALNYDNDVIQYLTFRVASPREAQVKLSYPDNVNGKINNAAIIPGHFEGKLFGQLDRPFDIRLGSKLEEIFDGKDDTLWECEYVTDNPVSSSFIVIVNVKFNRNVWINWININSDNDIEIARMSAKNEKIVITDYENEAASLVYTDNLVFTITQNYYQKLFYTLDAIVRNSYTLHTYNTFETYYKHIRELMERHLPNIKIAPVKEIEQHAGQDNVEQVVKSDKYRYAVAISDMQISRQTYKKTGVYETTDIQAPRNDIYAVEIETSSYYPNTDVDWIKYWLSFDEGTTWNRVRSKTESITTFTNKLKTRITLSDTEESDANTTVLNIISNKVRFRIQFQTSDEYITPVVHWYKLRIKMKGDDNE